MLVRPSVRHVTWLTFSTLPKQKACLVCYPSCTLYNVNFWSYLELQPHGLTLLLLFRPGVNIEPHMATLGTIKAFISLKYRAVLDGKLFCHFRKRKGKRGKHFPFSGKFFPLHFVFHFSLGENNGKFLFISLPVFRMKRGSCPSLVQVI